MIRLEELADIDAIHELTVAAFSASEFGHHGEAALIDELRENGASAYSLVASDGDVIVGHLLASTATIRNGDESVNGIAIGPMSVRPDRQCSGVGSQLINDLFERLDSAVFPFVIVFGHADYYPKFGFQLANTFGIQHAFEGLPQDLLFIKLLEPNRRSSIEGGRVFYNEAFGPQLAQ